MCYSEIFLAAVPYSNHSNKQLISKQGNGQQSVIMEQSLFTGCNIFLAQLIYI